MEGESISQKVKRLQIRTKHQVSDVLAGAYLSVFKGSGIEFEEVRPYVPGDEIRSIDWNVTARTGVPHVKRFVEERELTVILVVDISSSKEFGLEGKSKREIASEFAALLAFSAIANQDKIGLILFHSETELFIPPRKGQKHALRIVREVLSNDHEIKKEDLPWYKRWFQFRRQRKIPNGTNIAGVLEFCQKVLNKKSVVFVISDFIDVGFVPALSNTNRKHDVIATLISDKAEESFPDVGLIELMDSEMGNQKVLVDTSSDSFRQSFVRQHRKRIQNLQNNLRSCGIDLIHIQSHLPVINPLIQFLRMREKRGMS